MQKAHRFGYDHALRNCGVKIVEVETSAELEAAVTPQTAMMLFYNNNNPVGQIRDEEFVRLGKKHGVVTMNDCAADVPPVENLWKYTAMGFDLVAFSGGKGIRGPQSAGLLLGRKDLIAAARANASPNGNAIGRGMWNRRSTTDPLTAGYRQAILDVGGEVAAERMPFNPGIVAGSGLFSPVVRGAFPNAQRLDLDGLIGRAHSASYVPKTGEEGERLLSLLRGLHTRYADADGFVSLVYETEVFLAQKL